MTSGSFRKIRDDDDQSAAIQEFLEVQQGLGEIGAFAEFDFVDAVDDAVKLALARRGTNVVLHVFIENDEAGRVALMIRQVGDGAAR